MKKVFLSLLMVFLLTFGVFAATSGTLALSGTVSTVLDVVPSATSYTFNTVGATDGLLSSFLIKSNYKTSYTIAFTSPNSFVLTTPEVTTTWPYTLALYNGSTKLTPTSGYIYMFSRKTPKAGVSYDLKITYSDVTTAGAGSEWIEAGTYTDTITFTLTAS